MPDAKEILVLLGSDLLVRNQFTPLIDFLGWRLVGHNCKHLLIQQIY
jgi:hypothetical protein